MVDEQADPPPGIAQVQEHRALDALAPQRPPEAFDLAQRLRPPRRGHDLPDAALLQLPAKALLPRQVTYWLPLSVRISCGHAIAGDAARSTSSTRPRLAGVQAVADDEAAVVVHEGDQVHPAVLPLEDEGEQVGLPQLIGLARSK